MLDVRRLAVVLPGYLRGLLMLFVRGEDDETLGSLHPRRLASPVHDGVYAPGKIQLGIRLVYFWDAARLPELWIVIASNGAARVATVKHDRRDEASVYHRLQENARLEVPDVRSATGDVARHQGLILIVGGALQPREDGRGAGPVAGEVCC
jgi:hypothetical protein